MVAPGRGGARMPRGVFESNPRIYFRDLRAGKPLVYQRVRVLAYLHSCVYVHECVYEWFSV